MKETAHSHPIRKKIGITHLKTTSNSKSCQFKKQQFCYFKKFFEQQNM